MDRAELKSHIALAKCIGDTESKTQRLTLQFVTAHADPFSRKNKRGHITGSTLILKHDHSAVLLGRHVKFNRWLHFGGHGEPGETHPREIASREAMEETGINGLYYYRHLKEPFDLDIHSVPEYKGTPAHKHFDIRYLVLAPDGAEIKRQEAEQEEIRWFDWNELKKLDLDEGLRRMIVKAYWLQA